MTAERMREKAIVSARRRVEFARKDAERAVAFLERREKELEELEKEQTGEQPS